MMRWWIEVFVVMGIAGAGLVAAVRSGAIELGLLAIPVAVVLAWIALRIDGERWRDVGMRRPERWSRVVLWGVVGAGALHVILWLAEPAVEAVAGPLDLSQFEALRGNLPALLGGLVVVWTIAAFGEELVFRGFALERIARGLGGGGGAIGIALVVTSILFGFAHFYQGAAGIALTALAALVYGGFYIAVPRRAVRTLWVPILIHGFYDTSAFVLVYLGHGGV